MTEQNTLFILDESICGRDGPTHTGECDVLLRSVF